MTILSVYCAYKKFSFLPIVIKILEFNPWKTNWQKCSGYIPVVCSSDCVYLCYGLSTYLMVIIYLFRAWFYFKACSEYIKDNKDKYIYLFRAWFYCKACHEDVKDENQIKKCKCKNCKYIIIIQYSSIQSILLT